MARPKRHNKSVYRSGLEEANSEMLSRNGVPFEYEGFSIPYVQPAKDRKYTPDFLLLKNGILVETKGIFSSDDRAKHLLIKEQYPELDLRFVFSYSKSKIYKGSKTTHGMWAMKHGFQFADKFIPRAWFKEPTNQASIDCIERIRRSK